MKKLPAKREGKEVRRMSKQKSESPCTETGTRTFSQECVIVTDNGEEIAVAAMSITTLHGFQKEHTETLLSQFAQLSRSLYLEAGNALKTESRNNR